MTAHTKPQLILVTGGTGTTGRRIAERLTARGAPVRVGSRSGELPFDWDAPSTWAPVLDGAGAAYIAMSPELAFPGAVDTSRPSPPKRSPGASAASCSSRAAVRTARGAASR